MAGVRRILGVLACSVALVVAACHRGPLERTTPTGLTYADLRAGSGDTARAGDKVTMHEITTLLNGTVIFDSHKNNTPITFELGANQVISGVDQGVTGMRTGGLRRLIVPPSLSQRKSYPENTPRDSTLRIEVELVAIKRL